MRMIAVIQVQGAMKSSSGAGDSQHLLQDAKPGPSENLVMRRRKKLVQVVTRAGVQLSARQRPPRTERLGSP